MFELPSLTPDLRYDSGCVYLMMCCHGDCREGVVSLTHEQSRIVNHPIKPGDVVKVVAFAGQ